MNLHKNFGNIAATLAVVSLSLTALAQSTTTQSKTNVDSMFLQAASAGNAFEIETSKLALQKSTSAAIKKFAQMMITDHTKAQNSVNTLRSRIGGANGSAAGGGANGSSSGNGMTGNGSTGTGATGTGTGSSATGTGTGSAGTGAAGTGAGSAGTSSVGGTAAGTGTTGAGTGSTGTTGGSSNTMTGTSAASSMASMVNMLTPDQNFRVLTLASLSGQTFNKAYIKEQVNSHEASITVFAYAAKNASNAEVKAFAAKTLPTIQKHYSELVVLAK